MEPEWDIASDNILMKKIIEERNNAPIHAEQEKMREEAKMDAKKSKKRIDNIRKTQEELRQKFIKTNNFISECEKKKSVLEKKIAVEKAANLKLDKDIEELQEKLKRLNEYEENELKPTIAKLQVYEDAVQKMVDESDLFKSKEDFIDRCNALRKLKFENSFLFQSFSHD